VTGYRQQANCSLFSRPPDRCAVFAGGRSPSRWSARSGARTYDLDGDLSRRQDARREEDGRPALAAVVTGSVAAGTRCRAGCGEPRGRQRPAPGAPSAEARAKLPPLSDAPPPQPAMAHGGNFRRPSLAPAALARLSRDWPGPDGPARRRRALDDCEENPHSFAAGSAGHDSAAVRARTTPASRIWPR
jgi:hypothetical protein